MKISKHAVSPAVNRIYSSTFTVCVCVFQYVLSNFSSFETLSWILIVPVFLFQKQKWKSQTSLWKGRSEWRTRVCSRSPSNRQKSMDKPAKDSDSKFSTVKNLHSSQMLRKTSSYCKDSLLHTHLHHQWFSCACVRAFPPSPHEPSLIWPSEAQKLI